jgi:hypothetical protein
MSVFLTPDLQPITGGTYFPPTDSYNRPGFPSILKMIAERVSDHRIFLIVQGGPKLLQHAGKTWLIRQVLVENPRSVTQSALLLPRSLSPEALESHRARPIPAPKLKPKRAAVILVHPVHSTIIITYQWHIIVQSITLTCQQWK